MDNITKFSFKGQEIRIIEINKEPWFVALDICNVLDQPNVSQVTSRLKDYEKLTSKLWISGQNRDVLCISESGMYRLILSSRKPSAEEFQDWVCQEVLPEIRKKGYYSTEKQPTMTQIQVLQAVVNQMAEQEQRQLALEREISQQQQVINYQTQQISGILNRQTKATEYLNSVERSPNSPPLKPTRAKIVELVKSYAVSTSSDYRIIWNRLYREVYGRLGIDLKTRAKNAAKQQQKKINPLDIAESLDILEDLFAIASDILEVKIDNQQPKIGS